MKFSHLATLGALVSLVGAGPGVRAAERTAQDQAIWILQRVTGVKWPSDSPVVSQMTALIASGDSRAAAAVATQQPQFLSVTVKEMASRMSTREESVREPLNDFSAGVIGVTRDETDARELLYGNFYYIPDTTKFTPPANTNTDTAVSNALYDALESSNADIGATLLRVDGQQIATSATATIPNPDPGGILTSRAFLGAHAVAGTNRRMLEYSFREFMCTPLVGWADAAGPDIRIGRDVDRMPGGDPVKFQTTCKACHSVMDGFRGAFAKWDFNDNVGAAIHASNGVTSGGFQPNLDSRGVMKKMNRDDFVQFSGGYITKDDSFINNATRGVNATRFGWRGLAPDNSAAASLTGGIHTFGRLLANSQQFSRCWAKHVFDQVCQHDLSESEADALYASLAFEFEQNGYNLKKLFQAVATHPKCRL
jgi:hypothetical protein